MIQKRLRIFGGPNGSGKTTIINNLKTKINFGIYVNADDIEKCLTENGFIDFTNYNLELTISEVELFFKETAFSPSKLNIANLWEYFSCNMNKLSLDVATLPNSYIAADLAELIRRKLVADGQTLTYETVMSHPGKLSFISDAKKAGYRIYLYYIATEDPEININRVNIRVAQHGHAVKPEIIESRYYRSLENLRDAVLLTDRAYLFDNSGKVSRLLAEISEGREVEVFDTDALPNWFVKYLVEKR